LTDPWDNSPAATAGELNNLAAEIPADHPKRKELIGVYTAMLFLRHLMTRRQVDYVLVQAVRGVMWGRCEN
jgi:hypothetical protein